MPTKDRLIKATLEIIKQLEIQLNFHREALERLTRESNV